jgi:high-affinity Fe2+/Pb2+ permease
MGLVIVFMSPIVFVAGAFAPAMSSFIAMFYGVMVASALLGIALPVAIFWYMGRANVRAYFAREKTKTAGSIQSPSAE